MVHCIVAQDVPMLSVFDMDGNHLTYPLNVYVEPAFPQNMLLVALMGGFHQFDMMT